MLDVDKVSQIQLWFMYALNNKAKFSMKIKLSRNLKISHQTLLK